MIKRIFLCFLFVIFILNATSCILLPNNHLSRLSTKTEEEICKARIKNFIEALEKKDKTAIKDFFSIKTLKLIENIDKDIEYIFNLYKGDIISYEEWWASSESTKPKKMEVYSFCNLRTTKNTYLIQIYEKILDDENLNDIGVYMIRIVKEEDEYPDWEVCYGVWRPDIPNKLVPSNKPIR